MSGDPLLSVPGLGGYVAEDQRNRGRDEQDLSNSVTVARLHEHFTNQERERAFREELASVPPDQRNPETFARIGAKYAPAKDVFHYAQQSLDRKSHDAVARETALARLNQTAATAAQTYELRMRNLTRQEDKDAMTRSYQAYIANLRAEAAKYSTGATIAPFEAPQPQQVPGAAPVAPGPSSQALPANVPPSDAAAFAAAQAGGSSTVNRVMPAQETAGMQEMLQSAPPMAAASPAAAPASQPMPDAENLDARDIQARMAGGAGNDTQPGPAVAPAPVQAPQSAPDTGPQMPQFTGSPKDVARAQNAWRLKQSTAAGGATMDKDAIGVAAWEKLLFGTDPKGLGSASSAQRAQVANERSRIGKGLGLTDTEMAMLPQDNKVKMKAVDKMTTWGAFVDKAAEQVTKSMDVAISYAEKMDQTTIRLVNQAILAGKKQFNDPAQAGYAAALQTVSREYGRLMAGPTSNAMLPVEAMKKADEMLSQAMDVKALREVKKVMLLDAKITTDSVRNQITSLRGSITGAGRDSEAPAPAAAPPKPVSQMTNAELAARRKALAGGK